MSTVDARATRDWLADPDRLLDRDALLAELAPAVSDGPSPLLGVEPTYARAKRGVSAMLGLRMDWRLDGTIVATRGSLYLGSPARVLGAIAKARTQRLRPATIGAPAAEIVAPAGFYLAFPNDRVLRGLSVAGDVRRLKNRLHALGAPFSPTGLRVRKRVTTLTALRWKPGRRAVLLADLALYAVRHQADRAMRVFVRVYARTEAALALAGWNAAARVRGIGVPRVVVSDAELAFFAVEEAPGTAWLSGAAPGTRPWNSLGAPLRALYGFDAASELALPARCDETELLTARRALFALADWSGALRADCRALDRRLTAARVALPAVMPALVHGDLTADQVLLDDEGRVTVIDWDEAVLGDPHADLASLAVDLALRSGIDPAALAPFAREALAERWSLERWRWHVALAWARRCLAGLQGGRVTWRRSARHALEQALAWSEPVSMDGARAPFGTPLDASAPRRASEPAGAERGSLRDPLEALLDPESRSALVGERAAWDLTAVWPEGDGAIARLEADSGARRLWLRLSPEVSVWRFPEDPELPSLEPLSTTGRFELAAHRLGRRAALRDAMAGEYRYVRRPGVAARAATRIGAVHEALAASGAQPSARIVAESDGWTMSEIPGKPLAPHRTSHATWSELGRLLARIHSTPPPAALGAAGIDAACDAAARQVALAARLCGSFTRALDRHLARARERARAFGGHPPSGALVHGDLHPAQVLAGERLVVLDWERAHSGAAEEDVGNLCAHLFLALDGQAEDACRALLDGHSGAGARLDRALLDLHFDMALLRALAVHSWRDADRARCLDLAWWQSALAGGRPW